MIKSLQQAKRFLTILFGFTLLILGVAMLVLPGPGLITIVLGLGILAAEYVWARRLLDRVKRQGDRIRNSIFQRDKAPVSDTPPLVSPAVDAADQNADQSSDQSPYHSPDEPVAAVTVEARIEPLARTRDGQPDREPAEPAVP
jgi:hypothetical protein